MTHNTNDIEEFALSLPITRTARQIAQQFAREQPTPQKAEQVRLNTLAVCVVNDYLQQILGIPTDLSKSDSWNPVVRLCADVADLEVIGVGRLECRSLKSHQQTCHIPPEVWSDRIGYVVVQIDESSLEAIVLGFVQTATTEELSVSQLRPIDDLIDCLNPPKPSVAPVAAVACGVVENRRVNLSQWFTDVFESGWQSVEALLNSTELDFAFRFRSADSAVLVESEQLDSGHRRGNLIDLWIQLADRPVALIVELTPEGEKRNILLQVHPTGNQIYLPPLLQLTVLDESGLIFLEAQARSADNYIQLQFSGLPGEQFSVRVALGDASIVEDFVV